MDYVTRQIAEIAWDTLYNQSSTPQEATNKAIARQNIFGTAHPVSLQEYEEGVKDKMYMAQLDAGHLRLAENVIAFLKKERIYPGQQ